MKKDKLLLNFKHFHCFLSVFLCSVLSSCHSTTINNYSSIAIDEEFKHEGIIGFVSFLFGGAAVIGVLLATIIAIVTYLLYRKKKDDWDRFWNVMNRHLTVLFSITWLFGFCVYLVGSSLIIDANASFATCIWKLIFQAPMAVVYAFEMFMLSSDVSAIHEEFHNSLFFMTFFSAAHFMAAFVSTLFIIKYFGYNIFAKARLSYTLHFKTNIDELYIFWGMNDATYHLAKSINKTYTSGRKNGSYEIVIVNTADDDGSELEKEHTAVERLFSFLSFKNEELEQYKELGCLSVNVFEKLSRIKNANVACDSAIIEEKLNLKSLAKLISGTNKKVHIFLLSNKEEDNIIGTANLCHDTTICSFAENKNVFVYCHARYDSVNRVIEDKYSSARINVRVLDSAHESINILRAKSEYHPVNFVDIDSEENFGTVTSDFTALVVGFGETGRDAVRYLCEFGAFVDHKSTMLDTDDNVSIIRSPFKCYVADKNVNQLSGNFFASAQSMKESVEMWNTDAFSSEFYDNLMSVSQKLNYVVVAMGDNELNVAVAVRLFNYVRSHRTDLSKFRIFVRCYNNEQKTNMQKIADYYNQKDSKNDYFEHIVIFGTSEDMYTYEQVIENDFEHEGQRYNSLYCDASGKKGEKDIWATRHTKLLSQKTLNAFSELRRKESQDIANAYHAQTKLLILKTVSSSQKLPFVQKCLDGSEKVPAFIRQGKQVVTQTEVNSAEQILFCNLARLEHIRWIASHEILGYRSYADGDPKAQLVPDDGDNRHGCNERFKLHNCLVDWQDLDTEMCHPKNEWHPDYKLFDYIVITTTLMIHQERLKKERK